MKALEGIIWNGEWPNAQPGTDVIYYCTSDREIRYLDNAIDNRVFLVTSDPICLATFNGRISSAGKETSGRSTITTYSSVIFHNDNSEITSMLGIGRKLYMSFGEGLFVHDPRKHANDTAEKIATSPSYINMATLYGELYGINLSNQLWKFSLGQNQLVVDGAFTSVTNSESGLYTIDEKGRIEEITIESHWYNQRYVVTAKETDELKFNEGKLLLHNNQFLFLHKGKLFNLFKEKQPKQISNPIDNITDAIIVPTGTHLNILEDIRTS